MQDLDGELSRIQMGDFELSEKDIFLIFFSANIQLQFQEPHTAMVSFLGNLLTKAQVYVRTRNTENEANLANDISLKGDDTL